MESREAVESRRRRGRGSDIPLPEVHGLLQEGPRPPQPGVDPGDLIAVAQADLSASVPRDVEPALRRLAAALGWGLGQVGANTSSTWLFSAALFHYLDRSGFSLGFAVEPRVGVGWPKAVFDYALVGRRGRPRGGEAPHKLEKPTALHRQL